MTKIIYDIMLFTFRSGIDYYFDNKEGNVCEWEQSTWSPFYFETRIQLTCSVLSHCINYYHNSSRVRHGTRLQLIPFDFETMNLWSSLSLK